MGPRMAEDAELRKQAGQWQTYVWHIVAGEASSRAWRGPCSEPRLAPLARHTSLLTVGWSAVPGPRQLARRLFTLAHLLTSTALQMCVLRSLVFLLADIIIISVLVVVVLFRFVFLVCFSALVLFFILFLFLSLYFALVPPASMYLIFSPFLFKLWS